MKIVTLVDRALTDREVASMHQFRSYTDGISFACLGEGVMVMLHDVPEKDAQLLKEAAEERMDRALSVHPDFYTWTMDDGCQMVCLLHGGIFTMSAEPEGDNLGVYLGLRGAGLNACEQGEVIAVAWEE